MIHRPHPSTACHPPEYETSGVPLSAKLSAPWGELLQRAYIIPPVQLIPT